MARKESQREIEINEQIRAIGATKMFGTKKEVRALPDVLELDEPVLGIVSGLMDGNTWLIVCTDRRVVFLDRGLLWGLKQTEIPLDRISSVTADTGLMFGSITVLGSGLSGMKITMIEKAHVRHFARTVQQARKSYMDG